MSKDEISPVDDESVEEKRHRRKAKLLKHALKLKHVKPMTDTQERAYHAYFGGQNVVLHGFAGTGKTFISLYFALSELVSGRAETLHIVRSTVQGRDMGFMPGSEAEKIAHFETPYVHICAELFGKADAYKILKEKRSITFSSTAFLRGLTFEDSVVLVDEAQNMNFQELDTICTRLGNNSRLIVCGDFRQDDLNNVGRRRDTSGLVDFMNITRRMSSVDHIEFQIEDIVRSGFVREYIIAKTLIGS
jgi:phosphate starvation-inducible protein PhoH